MLHREINYAHTFIMMLLCHEMGSLCLELEATVAQKTEKHKFLVQINCGNIFIITKRRNTILHLFLDYTDWRNQQHLSTHKLH